MLSSKELERLPDLPKLTKWGVSETRFHPYQFQPNEGFSIIQKCTKFNLALFHQGRVHKISIIQSATEFADGTVYFEALMYKMPFPQVF